MEPRIVRVSAAASDILAVQVEEGWIEGGIQIPYQPLDGETLLPDVENSHLIWTDTNGEHTGVLVADEAREDQRFVLETRHGDELSEKADLSSSYLVNGRHPCHVWRKSKPSNMADPTGDVTLEHMIYLVLDADLRVWPGVFAWPASESFFDVYRLPILTEYTVQSSIGPNAYNWGYLAAARA